MSTDPFDFSQLQALIVQLQAEAAQIPPARKALLEQLADYVRQKEEEVRLNFICTHNSRRSHLAMIWAAVGAEVYGPAFETSAGRPLKVTTYSGGTEATAFNPRAVAALERAGFKIDNPGGDNPHYLVHFSSQQPALECWSKIYDDRANPGSRFGAIMTCSDADQNCPFIPDAELRLPLTYQDPKAGDDTPAEVQIYDERLREIGRELLYAFSLL